MFVKLSKSNALLHIVTPVLSVPVLAVKAAEAYRLGDVGFPDILAACEVGAGPCDFQDTVVGAGGKPQFLKCGFQHFLRVWSQPADLPDDVGGDTAVAADIRSGKALFLYLHRLLDAFRDSRGAFLRSAAAQVGVLDGLYLDLEVYAVKQRL